MEIVNLTTRSILAPTEWIIVTVCILFAVAKLADWTRKHWHPHSETPKKPAAPSKSIRTTTRSQRTQPVEKLDDDELPTQFYSQDNEAIAAELCFILTKLLNQMQNKENLDLLNKKPSRDIENKLVPLLQNCLAFYNHGGAGYHTWFEYYSYKTQFERLAKALLELKPDLPESWASKLRADVQQLGELSHHYFSQQEQLLESEQLPSSA